MAIVADLSGNFPASLPTGVDVAYSSVNRRNAGDPRGTLTPLYSGEVVQDSTTGTIYVATGLTSTTWAIGSIGS